jgi:hypothetical protein
VPRTVTLRNAGPNGDSAEDLYTDALEMLKTLESCPGIDTTEQSTGETYREILRGALKLLDGELQIS